MTAPLLNLAICSAGV